MVERQTVVSELSVGRWFESGFRDFFVPVYTMNSRIIVHASIADSISSVFPKENITITQNGIFDFIFPKRSIAYKIMRFPPDFARYKAIQSYRHVEILITDAPQEFHEAIQLEALPLPVTFLQNLEQIWILLANACAAPALPSKPDGEIIAKFIQKANSCSEYDALLLAQQCENLADYFSR